MDGILNLIHGSLIFSLRGRGCSCCWSWRMVALIFNLVQFLLNFLEFLVHLLATLRVLRWGMLFYTSSEMGCCLCR